MVLQPLRPMEMIYLSGRWDFFAALDIDVSRLRSALRVRVSPQSRGSGVCSVHRTDAGAFHVPTYLTKNKYHPQGVVVVFGAADGT